MICFLHNRSLIKISGEDSELFLQSQFSNDIKKIHDNEIQINAYCQHQGKIMALIWVFIKNDSFYLSLPLELKEFVLSKLNMYKLMSKVNIEDLSSQIYQYGVLDKKIDGSMKLTNNLSIYTSRKILESNCDINFWEKTCIDNNLPDIYLSTSEQFIPQSLNLDINEFGVSFTKGCYPGQEVVARMHYLGKPKRRLFRFVSDFKVSIGDSINVKNSKSLKSSGIVIRVVSKNHKYYFLGVFETQYINEPIFLNNDSSKLLTIINE